MSYTDGASTPPTISMSFGPASADVLAALGEYEQLSIVDNANRQQAAIDGAVVDKIKKIVSAAVFIYQLRNSTMKKFILLCLLLTFALVGCLSKSAETKTSAEDADNLLFITAPIVDKTTGQPVLANVYVFEGQALRDPQPSELANPNTDHVRLALQYLAPDDETGQDAKWVVVRADGYQTWAIQLLNNTSGGQRHYENRVELVPVVEELIRAKA